MATLYELDARLEALLSRIWIEGDTAIDTDTGEVLDRKALDDLQLEYSVKVDNICCYIKNLLADAETYKREAAWQKARAERAESRAKSLTAYLALHVEPWKRFSTAHCEIGWRKSEPVNVFDRAALPKEYIKTKTEETVDKVAIKKAIKSGIDVPGAELEQKINIRIK